jgi:hypothetical protein
MVTDLVPPAEKDSKGKADCGNVKENGHRPGRQPGGFRNDVGDLQHQPRTYKVQRRAPKHSAPA